MLARRFGTGPPRPIIRSAVALSIVLASPFAHAADLTGTVPAVADGDTFTLCAGVGAGERCEQIRLCGIDAPERGDALSAEATQAMRQLTSSATVTCRPVGEGTVCDGRSRRRNGNRLVAQCFVSGRDIAAELVRQGLACDWVRFSGGHYGLVAGGAECPPR
ncbi:MAG: thermonuclease family protein [Methyloligellaceae bacterium]